MTVGPRYTISPTSPVATSFICSSTMRASTFTTGVPTEPRLRSASSACSTHVTGLISVWPKKLKIGTPGRVVLIFSSTWTGVFAAPHDTRRRRRSRSPAATTAHTSSHCIPTKTHPVTR